MPFNNYDSPDFPPEIADVEISFTGLMILRPAMEGRVQICEAGMIIDSAHKRLIEVTDSRGEALPVPSGGEIKRPLKIYRADRAGNPIPTGVTKFRSIRRPFDGSESDHRLDFRWAVDLGAFHRAAPLRPDPVKVNFNDVKLKDGMLYTARRTDRRRLSVRLYRPGAAADVPWNRISAFLGANIYLQAGTSVVLEWEDGGTKKWTLNKGGLDGGPYRILIDNGPNNPRFPHDELGLHYNAMNPVLPYPQQFHLVFGAGSGDPALIASVDAPCMPSVLDGDGRI
jgi:hypothetical protein